MSNWKKTLTAVGLTCAIAVAGATAFACQKKPEDDNPPGPVVTQYTVTFDAQSGSAVASATVESNATVVKPADPTRAGYTFGGWYKDAACSDGEEWNFATDRVSGNLTLYAKWVAEAPVAGEIAWEVGAMPVIYSDAALYNKSRATEDVLTAALAGRVSATEDGAPIQTIVGIGELARDEASGLIPAGDYTITYTAMDSTGATHDREVTLTVKDAGQTNYYVEFKSARGGKGMEAVVGTRIRVAEDHYFTSTAEGELPDALKNPHAEGKIADLDDPFLLKNVAETAMTINLQDNVGTYLVFDAAGKVVWGFEGVMAYVTDETHAFPARVDKPATFTIPAGGYALVVGYTAAGNWYVHSDDGRTAVAGDYWGDAAVGNIWDVDGRQMTYMNGMYRYGNMVRVVKGGQTLTEPYTNQLPYIMKGYEPFKAAMGSTLTAAQLLAGVEFYDDNGAFTADTPVAAANVTVDAESLAAVDTATVGDYTVRYIVKDTTDETLETTFERTVTVFEPINYIKFGSTYLDSPTAHYNENYGKTALGADNALFMWDKSYTGGAETIPTGTYTVYIVINKHTGALVEAQDWSKLYNAANPNGTAITSANNQDGAKLRFATLGDEELLIVFAQGGAGNPTRTFGANLISAAKGDNFATTVVTIRDLAGVDVPVRHYLAFGTQVYEDPTVFYNTAHQQSQSGGAICILDKGYTGAVPDGLYGYCYNVVVKKDTGALVKFADWSNSYVLSEGSIVKTAVESGGNKITKQFFDALGDDEMVIVFHQGTAFRNWFKDEATAADKAFLSDAAKFAETKFVIKNLF